MALRFLDSLKAVLERRMLKTDEIKSWVITSPARLVNGQGFTHFKSMYGEQKRRFLGTKAPVVSFALKVTQEGIMWFAITSMAFGAAIGLNVFALWLADRFGQLQKRG
jgi:hypothetical protein